MSINGDATSHDGLELTDHQAAYIYTGTDARDDIPQRPTKKRRISKGKRQSKGDESVDATKFLPLLHGAEGAECQELRQQLFNDLWTETEKSIETILRESNEETLDRISRFVRGSQGHQDQIPTALITTGPNIASQDLLFKQVSERIKADHACPTVILRSGDAPNLKTALKKIIRDAGNNEEDEEDREDPRRPKGRKYLNYCLRNLQDLVQSRSLGKVVICFQDSEAFDSSLLTEVTLLLHSWLDRISFVLVFGIATSIELFHERLTRSAIRCLEGEQFDVEDSSLTIERLFQKTVAGTNAVLRLGPNLLEMLLERQHDHIQSVQDFVNSLKYAYMCHFYSNPLSSLLALPNNNSLRSMLVKEHFEAIRSLSSFKILIESLLNNGKTTQATLLLRNDDDLYQEVLDALGGRREKLDRLIRSMYYLSIIDPSIGYTELYMRVFSGALLNDEARKIVSDTFKQAEPKQVETMLQQLIDAVRVGDPLTDLCGSSQQDSFLIPILEGILSQLSELIEKAEQTGKTINSRDSIQNRSVRTTIVAQKVLLSRDKAAVSIFDQDYTELLDEILESLSNYLIFENPQTMFLNEIWLYDSKSPIRDVFMPRPRFAVERALSMPHDYLGCSCCASSSAGGLSATQPATAIIYQLYLESGTLINAFDLWSAFYTIISGETGEDLDERSALVLFYRALSDLKLLGMIKQSRKKTDHLSKMSWKGL